MPRPLRVLMVVDSLDIGGGERHAVDLAIALHRRGHMVTVACSTVGSLSHALEAGGVPVQPLMDRLVKRRVCLDYGRRLLELLRDEHFDLVHAHLFASAAASALACIRTGVPLVVTQHSEAVWRGPLERLHSRWTYRHARRVIAVSRRIQALLIAEDGVPPSCVAVVPNAVTPVDSAAGQRIELPLQWPGRPVVGMVARLEQEKGGHVFLHAAALILERVPDCQFLVVGDGPLRGRLEAQAAELRARRNIHFVGFQQNARSLLGRLDVLALPSLSEGAPLVVLEAMAAGVPVVASKVGGVPEQLRHGEGGLLVPPGDPALLSSACLELLLDPARARLVGESGRRNVPPSSYETMVRRTEFVYHGVLGAEARSGSEISARAGRRFFGVLAAGPAQDPGDAHCNDGARDGAGKVDPQILEMTADDRRAKRAGGIHSGSANRGGKEAVESNRAPHGDGRIVPHNAVIRGRRQDDGEQQERQ